jgi:hypothetical protein
MKRYIDKLHARSVHEKREFAVHAAAGIIAVVFLVWFSTLGVRFMSEPATTTAGADATSLIAATAAAGAMLEEQVRETYPAADPTDDPDQGGMQTAPAQFLGTPMESSN